MPSNPEIRRNIWLEFSRHRLLAMPIILGVIFFVVGRINTERAAQSIAAIALTVYFFIVKVWGGYKAAGAVIDEVNEHTWDYQKLSALSPWNLTLGKLFGSTLYAWYGGVMAFFAFVGAAYYLFPPETVMLNAALLLTGGLVVHVAALLSSMSALQGSIGTHQKLRTILHLAFGILIGGIFSPRIQPAELLFSGVFWQPPTAPQVPWYGGSYNFDVFMVITGVLVLQWLVSSIYWQMRTQMKMRTGPWLWVGFLIFWAFFLSGFEFPAELFNGKLDTLMKDLSVRSYIILGVFYLGLYFILFQEPWTGVSYRRFLDAWKNKNYWKFVDLCPSWIITFPLLIVAAVSTYAQVSTTTVALFVVSLLCFAARDIALLHYFKLSPTNRRPKQSALFYMGVLYLLLPFMLHVFHLNDILAAFVPVPGEFVTTAISAFFQALIVSLLAYSQWKRHWTRYD